MKRALSPNFHLPAFEMISAGASLVTSSSDSERSRLNSLREDLGGIADGAVVCGHIASDNSAGADDRVVADRDAFQDDGAGTDKDKLTNLDGARVLDILVAPAGLRIEMVKVIIENH